MLKKLFKVVFAAMLALSLIAGAAACKKNNNTTTDMAVDANNAYQDTIIYDISATAYNASVKAELPGGVQSVAIGRNKAANGEFSYKDGTLVISGAFLSKQNAGEKEIIVTLDNGSVKKIPAIFATKIITTAQEFQDINKNLSGTYVLGNDIDLSTIGYFQPLGYYFTEQDPNNDYFHGLLEGNGYTVKNAKVWYSDRADTAQAPYEGNGYFTSGAHRMGDNIGIFQVIGSSGVVRNVCFDKIHVRARTIAGVIAGNCMGEIKNCIVTNECKVEISTHFYDDDCNVGGVVGIVAGGGRISDTISLTTDVSVEDIFTDYSDDYKGKTGNGWDHTATPGNTDPTWKFAGVNKSANNVPVLDSNGSKSNGVYAFAGKVWGTVENCYSALWTKKVYVSENKYEDIPACFGQTHLKANKETSGNEDLGTISNCFAKSLADLKSAANYAGFDKASWNIVDGNLPSLNRPYYAKANG